MSEHLPEFETALAQYLGAGVAACYRGNRLFDSPAALAVVKKWVGIYKEYRDLIAGGAVIHVRRPNGQTLDSFMNAMPSGPHRALALVFNPTGAARSEVMTFPLYYAGIAQTALVSLEGATPAPVALARDYSITLNVTVAAQGVTWIAISSGD